MGQVPTGQKESYRRQSAPDRNYSYRNEYWASAPSRYDNRYENTRRAESQRRYNQRSAYTAQTSYRRRYVENTQTARSAYDGRGYSSGSINGAYRYSGGGANYSAPARPYPERDVRASGHTPQRYGTYTNYPPAAPQRRRYDRPERETRTDVRDTRPAQRRVLTREQREAGRKKVRARMKMICLIGVIFLMSAVMIYRQTAIFGKNREIERLNNELSGILVTNEGIQSSIDRSIELGNLETYAKNRLGMINPDSSQIFYVDMGARDEVVKSSSSK